MAKLFISYRRSSWPFTHRLADDLRDWLDAEIFVDSSGIDETDFEHSLLRNLRESDAVLLIVSPETFADRIHNERDWVRREIREALAAQKPLVMACIDGLYPPDNLPEDISAVKRSQGIPFYSDFFEAAVEKLARFISRSTPIVLRSATPTGIPSKGIPEPPKQRYHMATQLLEEGRYEPAIAILERLLAEGFTPRIGSIEQILQDAQDMLSAEERQREAREIYDELVAFARTARTAARMEEASVHWERFRCDYPEFADDTHGLGEKLAGAAHSEGHAVPDTPAEFDNVITTSRSPADGEDALSAPPDETASAQPSFAGATVLLEGREFLWADGMAPIELPAEYLG